MNARFSFVMQAFIVATTGIVLLFVGLRQVNAIEPGNGGGAFTVRAETVDNGPIIQATERISIPFGFNPALPLMNNGALVTAVGQGGCTAGEAVTIVFTVTQPSTSESVNGVWNGVCTGERQTWRETPAATPLPSFSPGTAEACAYAETEGESGVSDTQTWCDDVILTPHWVYLPVVLKP